MEGTLYMDIYSSTSNI